MKDETIKEIEKYYWDAYKIKLYWSGGESYRILRLIALIEITFNELNEGEVNNINQIVDHKGQLIIHFNSHFNCSVAVRLGTFWARFLDYDSTTNATVNGGEEFEVEIGRFTIKNELREIAL